MSTNALSKLKNMFWVAEDSGDTTQPDESKKEPIINITKNTKTEEIPLRTLPAEENKNSNKEAIQLLQDAIKNSNKPGYDYFEFLEALKTQSEFIPSEETRFASVFAMAKSMGVSVESLLRDIDYYQEVLAKEEANFKSFLNQQMLEGVTEIDKKISDLEAKITEKREELNRINEQINTIAKEKAAYEIAITDNRAKIEKARLNFETALKDMRTTFVDNASKIKRYLNTN